MIIDQGNDEAQNRHLNNGINLYLTKTVRDLVQLFDIRSRPT